MSSTRRDFLERSASAAAALTLAPLTSHPAAEALESIPATRAVDDPAAIRAFEARMVRARPLPLERVRVTGGPLKRAQDVTAKYLLSLEPDRMMAFYRTRAGLTPKAEPYGGWDGAREEPDGTRRGSSPVRGEHHVPRRPATRASSSAPTISSPS